MYQGFSVTSIHPNFGESMIEINTSFDIDPSSVNESTIQLFSKAHRTDSNIDFVVNGKKILVLIKEDIIPNTSYIVRIAGIKTVIGDELESGIRRTITFDSMVKEIPYIVTPANNEEIVDLKVTLKAMLEDKEFETIENKTYFIQIAKDVAFINLVLETSTPESTINLKDIEAGQYYIRARVESMIGSKKEHGKWSETITFISLKGLVPDSPCDEEDDGPIFIQDIDIVTYPQNGETPESILIEFSGEIDPDSIDKIIVIRRDV